MGRPVQTETHDMETSAVCGTFCEDCDNVESASRKDPPWKWLCRKSPRPPDEGFGWVTKSTWDKAPPLKYCRDVNRYGECEMFEERRDAVTTDNT